MQERDDQLEEITLSAPSVDFFGLYGPPNHRSGSGTGFNLILFSFHHSVFIDIQLN